MNADQFLAMPSGTIFSTYDPDIFDGLYVKGATLTDGYFQVTDILEAPFDPSVDEDEGATRSVPAPNELAMDFDNVHKSVVVPGTTYAVYDPADVEALMARLHLCLPSMKDWNHIAEMPMSQTLVHGVHRVYFHAGLLAMRALLVKHYARTGDEQIAQSLSTFWPVHVGEDPGDPRKMTFQEITTELPSGGYEINPDMTPSTEALPIALEFMEAQGNLSW